MTGMQLQTLVNLCKDLSTMPFLILSRLRSQEVVEPPGRPNINMAHRVRSRITSGGANSSSTKPGSRIVVTWNSSLHSAILLDPTGLPSDQPDQHAKPSSRGHLERQTGPVRHGPSLAMITLEKLRRISHPGG